VDSDICIGCGECVAVCPAGAVDVHCRDISNWGKGRDTLPIRMVDYVVGLMNGKWNTTIHVLHMYDITEKCDCVNFAQQPLISRDIGFLVGKNPFAVDLIAGKLLSQQCSSEEVEIGASILETVRIASDYARDVYNIFSEVPIQEVAL
jgi:uncharacterized Fe-S center protein